MSSTLRDRSPLRLVAAVHAALAFSLLLLVSTTARASAADCDVVKVALGQAPISDCPGIDRNGDGAVSAAEILGGEATGVPRGGGVVTIDIGTATGAPGAVVPFEVSMDGGGFNVAATLNDIHFTPEARIAARANAATTLAANVGSADTVLPVVDASGLPDFGFVRIDAEELSYSSKSGNDLVVAARGEGGTLAASHSAGAAVELLEAVPDCTVNPNIHKAVATAFQPPSCTPGVDCTGVRVIVISLSNLDPIPDGPLYTCNAQIDATAPPGTYPLVSTRAEAADVGDDHPTIGTDGAIVVLAPLDHFKCYKVKDLKEPKFAATTVALSDQFVDDGAEVKKPFLLCNPVDKNGEGIHNPVDHLVCYKIKSPKLDPPQNVQVTNQFGTLKLQAKKSSLLCMPSSKQVLP